MLCFKAHFFRQFFLRVLPFFANKMMYFRVGYLLIQFRSESLVVCQESEQMSDLLKKWVIRSFAHFWWATWVIAHGHSFDLSNEQPERFAHFAQKEWANLLLFLQTSHKNVRTYKNTIFSNSKKPSELLIFAHFIWATWAICSQSLICPEQPCQIAHISSFVLSHLSDWSKWANEQIPNPGFFKFSYEVTKYSTYNFWSLHNF